MLATFKTIILAMYASMTLHGQPINVDVKETSCMAAAVFYESKSESYEGKLAVANTVKNRTENERFPSTVCGVIKQKNQFVFYKHPTKIDIQNESVYKQVLDSIQVAVTVMYGHSSDNTHGAVAFINPRLATNKGWLRHFHKTVSIGGHSFYALREYGETTFN